LGPRAHPSAAHVVLVAHQAAGRKSRPRSSRLLGGLVLFPLAIVLLLLVAGGVAGAYSLYRRTVATVASPGEIIAGMADYGGAQIYDRAGNLLYRFPDPSGGIQIPVPLTRVSKPMIDATISTEDANFWSEQGLDVGGTLRAATVNLQQYDSPFAGRGGSGITQQLVKETLIPANERESHSIARKLTEAAFAVALTRTHSKEQILEWYLNMINYGGVYDGVESAAQGYFGVHASQLTLAQATILAGIPQSPAMYSPYANPDGARVRQAQILDLMVKHHYIDQEQAERAKAERLSYQPPQQALPLRAPWFVEYVKQQLVARFGQHCFDTCGLQVTTTLDSDLQDKAQEILNDNLRKWGQPVGVYNGALLSIDARTGEILVMLGSRNYDDDSPRIQGKNNFTTAVMQPGSSFKPVVYTTLFLKRGYGPDSIIWDAPYQTPDGYKCQDPVKGGATQGPIPVRLALGSSLNCPGNRAADVAGIKNVIDTAHTLGITTMPSPAGYGASIATGGANITMLDLAYAYTTIARNGNMIGESSLEHYPDGYRKLDPVAFTEVKNGQGEVLYHYEPKTEQVVPAAYPYLVTSIISNCNNRRLIWQCGFPEFVLSDGRPVAAKTGTQQGADTGHTIANWQFMYTPQIVTGGWVGNADRSPWTDVNGGANAVGYSVQQLEDLITRADEIPPKDFERPDDVVSVKVHVPDGSRGLLGGCGPIEDGLFARGTEPDVNNRVCRNGAVVVPQEQVGTGGLGTTVSPNARPGPDPALSPRLPPTRQGSNSVSPYPPAFAPPNPIDVGVPILPQPTPPQIFNPRQGALPHPPQPNPVQAGPLLPAGPPPVDLPENPGRRRGR
jgi:membrane peptidoglycan carboxypeptidase